MFGAHLACVLSLTASSQVCWTQTVNVTASCPVRDGDGGGDCDGGGEGGESGGAGGRCEAVHQRGGVGRAWGCCRYHWCWP